MSGLIKAVICVVLFVGYLHFNDPLLPIRNGSPFLSWCPSGSLPCLKEGNVLFNDALNTFYLRLYGVRYMVKDHSDSERGNLLQPHRLLFPISCKGSFLCTIPQTG